MITPSECIAFIKKIHLFSDLSEEDLNDVAQALTDKTFKPGERIIEQGTRGDTFYIIFEGYVKVTRRQGNTEVTLARLGPQDYFGEEELFRGRTRSASIVALTECTVLMLNKNKLDELVKRVPSFKPTFEVVIDSHKLWRSLQFKWVRPDEVVYFMARKHPILLWRALVWPSFSMIFPAVAFVWGIVTGANWVIAFAVVGVMFILGWIAWRVVDWGNDYYMVTNQRVVWVEKVVGIFDSRTEAPLSTILSVGVETDALGRALNYGNVIVRTFVGKIGFNHVGHPRHAARMIEEYWNRTKEHHLSSEKEAMKDAIRKRLNLPIPPKPEPPAPEPTKFSPRRRPNVLQLALANVFKLRLEEGETVIYRKHVFVLLEQIWQPSLFMLAILIAWLWRGILLLRHSESLDDVVFLSLPLLFLPFLVWWIYQYLDWSNDIFQVTSDQIIDIDKKPFGTEERRAASLENILSTESKRIGLLGNIFNYGTVFITVGGSKLEFQDVFDPNTVQSDIDRRRMARIAAKNAALAAQERERMAEWIATYHRSFEEFRHEEQNQQTQRTAPNPEYNQSEENHREDAE